MATYDEQIKQLEKEAVVNSLARLALEGIRASEERHRKLANQLLADIFGRPTAHVKEIGLATAMKETQNIQRQAWLNNG